MAPSAIAWLGTGFLIVGIAAGIWQHVWLSKAIVCRGTVVEMVLDAKGKSAPRVQFKARNGSIHVFTGSVFSRRPDYKKDDSLFVAYSPSTYRGRILTFEERFSVAAVLASLGIGMICMGGIYAVGAKLIPGIYVGKGDAIEAHKRGAISAEGFGFQEIEHHSDVPSSAAEGSAYSDRARRSAGATFRYDCQNAAGLAVFCLVVGSVMHWARPVYPPPAPPMARSINMAARPVFEPVRDIGMSAFQQWLPEGKAVIIDTRPHSAYQVGHIPGALGIPRDQFARYWRDIVAARSAKPYSVLIIYGHDAADKTPDWMANETQRRGIGPAAVYRGGWKEWQASTGVSQP